MPMETRRLILKRDTGTRWAAGSSASLFLAISTVKLQHNKISEIEWQGNTYGACRRAFEDAEIPTQCRCGVAGTDETNT